MSYVKTTDPSLQVVGLQEFIAAAASTTADAPSVIEDRLTPEELSLFQPSTADEVANILNQSQTKQYRLDPAPTWLVKRASGMLAPVIAGMCNASF